MGLGFLLFFFSPIKEGRLGICVICSFLKVVLFFILCSLFWNAVGSKKIRRIMI